MERVTVEQAKEEIEKNREKWSGDMRRKFPGLATTAEYEDVYFCSRWLGSRLFESGLSREDADPSCIRLTNECLEKRKEHGSDVEDFIPIYIEVAVNIWNDWVDRHVPRGVPNVEGK